MAIFPKAAYLVTGNVLVVDSLDIGQGRKECHIETTEATLVKINWATLDVLKKKFPLLPPLALSSLFLASLLLFLKSVLCTSSGLIFPEYLLCLKAPLLMNFQRPLPWRSPNHALGFHGLQRCAF